MNAINPVDILLVDDNPHDIKLTIKALAKYNLANRLYAVEDGIEALDFLFCREKYASREGCVNPKVVLLDLSLPKMNGLEVLKIIKDDERTKYIPVVLVTSSKEDPDIKAAYALGASSYVVKPISFDAFSEAMSHLGMYWLLLNQPPVE